MEEGKRFERRLGKEPAGEEKEKKPKEDDEELPPEYEEGGESGEN